MSDSNDPEAEEASTRSAVDAARSVIWRLFEDGQLDEDHATEALLAVDVEARRIRSRRASAGRCAGAHGIRPLLSAVRRGRPG
jgi:hypothetical protein